MSLTIEEQEICINATRDEKYATAYCSDRTCITKFDKLVEKSPELFEGVEQMSVYGGTKRYVDANSLKEDIAGARIIQKPKYLDAEETFDIIDMQPTAEVEEINH